MNSNISWRLVLATISRCVLSFLVGAALFSTSPVLRAFEPSSRATPTINKKVNARLLANHRASDFVQVDDPIALKAIVQLSCTDQIQAVRHVINTLSKNPITVQLASDANYCTVHFGFDLKDHYLLIKRVNESMWAGFIEASTTQYDVTNGEGASQGADTVFFIY